MFEKRRVLFGEPVQITASPERNALVTALKAIEAREGERKGWDQPPRLFSLHLADIDSGAVELRVIPPRVWTRGRRNPADDLLAWAQQVPETGPVDYLAFADSPDGFAGLAFMVEAWAAPMDTVTPEEAARRAAGERTFLDAGREGRREARMVMAVDVNGHAYTLQRLRGDAEPRVGTTGADPDHLIEESRGRAPYALGRLVHAVRTGALRLG
ncbi:hypothetical protein ACFVXG_45590 [Kitasatospora sp. NPDC058162]|uniref:hypothetical protein n=1 Tax=Kitasatospora sp. NPDC058162 TaxID=3346362 RepID=UPI0036D771E6